MDKFLHIIIEAIDVVNSVKVVLRLDFFSTWAGTIIDYTESRASRRDPSAKFIVGSVECYNAVGNCQSTDIIKIASLAKVYWFIRIFVVLRGRTW